MTHILTDLFPATTSPVSGDQQSAYATESSPAYLPDGVIPWPVPTFLIPDLGKEAACCTACKAQPQTKVPALVSAKSPLPLDFLSRVSCFSFLNSLVPDVPLSL